MRNILILVIGLAAAPHLGADAVARFRPQLMAHLPQVAASREVAFTSQDDGSLVARREDSAAPFDLRVAYPQTYDRAFVVGYGDQRITVRSVGAAAASVRTEQGKVFYADVYVHVDAVQVPGSRRSEEILLLGEKGAPLVYEYRVTDLRGVADVVLDRGGVRFVPETAAPAVASLAIERPWVIDATGLKSETAASWEVSNDGDVVLRLIVDDAGLQYPLLVDPSYVALGDAMVTPRRLHSAALLHDGRVLISGGWNDGSGPVRQAEIFDRTRGYYATGSTAVDHNQSSSTVLRDGRVLIAGGSGGGSYTPHNVAELYDPATGTFSVTGAMQHARREHSAILLPDGRVLIVGGANAAEIQQPQATAEIFDPATGVFTATGSMTVPRTNTSIAMLPNGKILVVGGCCTGVNQSLTSAEVYDPALGTFAATGSMAASRAGAVTMLLPNGPVLVSGGINNGSDVLSSELYDFETGTFSTTGATDIKHDAAAGLMPNGKPFVAGDGPGHINALHKGLGEYYNPATGVFENSYYVPSNELGGATGTMLVGGELLFAIGDTSDIFVDEAPAFSSGGSMGTARELHTATLLPNGRVLIAGGRNAGGTLATTEIYNPATGLFSSAAPMAATRYGHAATLLTDGRVLVTGGGTTTTEIYDPATNSWSATGTLVPARRYHAATLVTDGRVLVTGGSYIAGPMTRAEIWDPQTGTFAVTGFMSVTRSNHGAVVLPDQRVLVAGGGSEATALAEVWHPVTNVFTSVGSGATARRGARTTLLHDGTVLISGGNEDLPAPTERFDPTTLSFSAFSGNMPARPSLHSATLLIDGRVFMPGVTISDSAGRIVTKAFLSDRTNHQATLLPDGRVLVTGGLAAGGATAFAEIFSTGQVIQESRRPVVSSITPIVCQSGSLLATGTAFSSPITGASGRWNGTESNLPLLQLRRLEGDRTIYARPVTRDATTFQSAALWNLPLGHYRATISSNGIESVSSIIRLLDQTPPVLSDYPHVSVVQGMDATVTPPAPPSGPVKTVTVQATAGFLGTLTVDRSTGTVTINDARPPGLYTVSVSAASECVTTTETFTLNVQPLTAPLISANAVSTSRVNVTWASVNGAASYEIFQKTGAGAYVSQGLFFGTSAAFEPLTAGTSYLYRVRAVDEFGGAGPQSVPDLATTMTFANLAPGTPAIITAEHLQQLRVGANAVRAAAGQAAVDFTDSSPAGVLVKAIHLQELHSAITSARTALSLPDYKPTSFAMPSVGAPVRSVDFTILQNGLR